MSADGRAGFTLIELLVVMAVAGLVLALAVPRFDRAVPALQLDRAAASVSAALKAARGQAVRENRSVAVVVDTANGMVGDTALPQGVAVDLFTAESEKLDDARGAIRFFGDGGATGGGIALHRGGQSRTITVDWLTGDVETRAR